MTTEPAFLDRIGDLTIPDLWNSNDPIDLLESLGYIVHYARRPKRSNAQALDMVLEDTRHHHWYAVRLGDYTHDDEDIWWDQKAYRLLLLFNALSEPTAGPAPTLSDLVQNLGSGDPGEFDTSEGDGWGLGVLLLAALYLLHDTEQETAHRTLLALKQPTLLTSIDALSQWMDNVEDDDWEEQAGLHLKAAVNALWPTLDLGPNLPDPMLEELLLTTPRKEWAVVAERILIDAAANERSTTYSSIVEQWKAQQFARLGHGGSRFTRHILEGLTVGSPGTHSS